MKELWRRLRWFGERERFESELEEEMRHHLALKAEEQGSAAARQFGNVTLLKEDSRAMWGFPFWEQVMQDLRYAVRAMAANKLFTAMAVGSLALGIGANTAIYSFMDAIMIRALPVRHPEELVLLNWQAKGEAPVVTDHSGTGYEDLGAQKSPDFPYPAYEFLRKNNTSFSTLFGFAGAERLNLQIDGQADLADGQFVSGDYFSGLSVHPVLGHLISPDDDQASASPVIVITYALWQKHFGGSASAVGKSILVNGKPFTIAGVTPPEFYGITPQSTPQVFIPVRLVGLVDPNLSRDYSFQNGHFYWLDMMGRLKPGVSMQAAQSELAAKFHQWVLSTATTEKERADLPALWTQEGGSGVDALRRRYSKPLFILMTMVGLILTIACANLANLLLARSAARRREMAVRLSLGAGRFRIIRQLLTESLLLSLCGGVFGIFVGALGIRALTLLLADGREDFDIHAQMDWRVLLFTLLIVFLSAFLFGFAPAIQATRVDVTPALKEAHASTPRARRRRFGIPFGLSHVLVVWQIASALLLVSAAGLFARTLSNLRSVAVGFNQENLLLFHVDAAQAGYSDSSLRNLYTDLQRRFGAVPGVRSVTMTHMRMVSNSWSSTNVTIPGRPVQGGRKDDSAVTQVGPRFFETMQIPVLLGRSLDERDHDGAPGAAVVNEVFAKKFFPGVSALHRHFSLGGDKDALDLEIVGISKTVRYDSLKDEVPPVAYISFLQTKNTLPLRGMYYELRTAGEPLALAHSIYQIVHEAAPRVPVADMTTQTRTIEHTFSQERTFADLCTCFGALSLTMACIGLYGMMAYAVTRRTSEIGIRMALGAERGRIIWMVLREVIALGAVGLVIGSVAVWQTTAFLKSFLFGLQPNDPVTLASAAGVLIVCAVVAGYVPAWRASRIDSMTAVRHE
jgi:predicted permease